MSTIAYRLALKKVNEATRLFHEVQAAYRARKVDDAAYLAARKAYEEADKAFEAVARGCVL